jgi:hypothetical protein
VDVKPEVVDGRAEDFCEPPGRRPDAGLAGGGGLWAAGACGRCSSPRRSGPAPSLARGRPCRAGLRGGAVPGPSLASRRPMLSALIAVSGCSATRAGWCIAPGPRDAWQARARARNPAAVLCSSFLSFGDPDGNGRLLQEITARLSGRWPGTMPRRIRAVDKVPGSWVRGRQRLRRPARPAGRLGDVRVPFHDPGLSKPAYANAPHVRANDMEKGTTPCALTSHPVEPSPTTS